MALPIFLKNSLPALGKVEFSVIRSDQARAAQPLARYVKKGFKYPVGWILTDAIDSIESKFS